MSVRRGPICGHVWTHMPVHEEATFSRPSPFSLDGISQVVKHGMDVLFASNVYANT